MSPRRKSSMASRRAALAQAATLAAPDAFHSAAEVLAAAKQFEDYLVFGRLPPIASTPRLIVDTARDVLMTRPKT